MSNIALKGDVVQDLGEYIPNPYIESIEVEQPDSRSITLRIHCSLLVLISDDYNVEDVAETIREIGIYSVIQTGDEKQLKKQTIIDRLSSERIPSSQIYTLDTGDGISDMMEDGNYQDDLYDEEGRRIFKVNFSSTISNIQVEQNIERGNVYIYIFSSILPPNRFSQTSPNSLYLNIGNIAYEKIFSPGLNILREEEVIYVGSQGEKYGQVPLLGLNRNFYKTQTVSREDIISKVNSLIRRFEGRSIGPLSDSVNSIKTVLSKEADTENLLVQLDKVRRSFPNKTNNNPVGNLHAAFTVLLQNINSAFRPVDIVKKDRYLTGKVLDLRTATRTGFSPPQPESLSQYLPEEMFFVHRERVSQDETDDLSLNRGMFFIQYEQILKRESNISKLLDINKLYEMTPSIQLDEMKRILFSYLRVKKIVVKKHYQGDLLTDCTITYGEARDNRAMPPYLQLQVYAVDPGTYTGLNLFENNFAFDNPSERMLCYSFVDADRFTAIYEQSQIEDNGGMVFNYEVKTTIYDETQEFARYLSNQFASIHEQFANYVSLAEEVCSFNNIDNRFNDFFVKSIRERYPSGQYPWETAPTIYSMMSYLLTNDYESFEDVVRYSKNVSATISPENGNLQALQDFAAKMNSMALGEINSLNGYFAEGLGELFRTYIENDLEKTVSLLPFNYVQLETEQEAEFESLQSGGPITISYLDIRTVGGIVQGVITPLTWGASNDFHSYLLQIMGNILNKMVDKNVMEGTALPAGVQTSSDTFVTFLNWRDHVELATGVAMPTDEEIFKPVAVLLNTLNNYFKGKRDQSLRENGLNYYFDYGVSEKNSIESDLYMVQTVDSFRDSMTQILSYEYLAPYINVDIGSESYDVINSLVRTVLDYYRLNTDRLMWDLNRISFFAAAAGHLGDSLEMKVYRALIDNAINLSAKASYSGPGLSEIANIEDISF